MDIEIRHPTLPANINDVRSWKHYPPHLFVNAWINTSTQTHAHLIRERWQRQHRWRTTQFKRTTTLMRTHTPTHQHGSTQTLTKRWNHSRVLFTFPTRLTDQLSRECTPVSHLRQFVMFNIQGQTHTKNPHLAGSRIVQHWWYKATHTHASMALELIALKAITFVVRACVQELILWRTPGALVLSCEIVVSAYEACVGRIGIHWAWTMKSITIFEMWSCIASLYNQITRRGIYYLSMKHYAL